MKKVFQAIVFVLCFAVLGAGLLAGWLAYTPWGARFTVREIARRTLGSHKVSWADLEGSLARGIHVRHLEVRDIPRLPAGNFLRIQSLSVGLSVLALQGLDVDVENARLFPHGDEPIVVNGTVRGNTFTANVYTRNLDLSDAREILMKFFDVPPMKGLLNGIDLDVSGAFDRPRVTGRLTVERIVRNEFVLRECPVLVDLNFVRASPRWETYGRLELLGGWVERSGVRIDLLDSWLTFAGKLINPGLDVNATSRVNRTKINISVQGTRDKPRLSLTSDAPYPKEQLLLMLATGRSWSGMGSAVDTNKMTPQLTSDFVDYFLFGGSRGKVVEWLALSDVSLIAEERAQGVSLSKDVTDKFGVGYGVKVGARSADRTQPREVTQTLESDYRLTDRLTISAQKELRAARQPSGGVPDSADMPDDRIFLRYRSQF